MTNEEAINYINSIKHMFENGINRTTCNCTVLGGEALELYKNYIEACELAVQVMILDEDAKQASIPDSYLSGKRR